MQKTRSTDGPPPESPVPPARHGNGIGTDRTSPRDEIADREKDHADWYLSEDFWRTFYACMFNEDTFAAGEHETAALLKLAGGEPRNVLDLGAGPGRHALPLARSGYNVTAVDTSRYLLDLLAARAEAGGLEVEILERDMRDFRRTHAFDLALLMWTSFGYFDDAGDHLAVLRNVRESLAPGGRLVLDLVGKEYLCRNLQPVHLTEYDDGRLLVERPALCDEMTRLENEWFLIDGNEAHRAHFSHAVWSAAEVRDLLARAGMIAQGVYGSLGGDEYDLDAERLIVIAAGDYHQ